MTIGKKQAELKRSLDSIKVEKATESITLKIDEAKYSDLKDIKKQLQEAETKELKACTETKKKLGLVNKSVMFSKTPCVQTVGSFLFDSITCFITGSCDASFKKDGQKSFATVESLNKAVRDINHTSMDKKDVETIMA